MVSLDQLHSITATDTAAATAAAAATDTDTVPACNYGGRQVMPFTPSA